MKLSDIATSQSTERSFTYRYGIAVAATALAALFGWLVPEAVDPEQYLGFYPAVVVAAALGGVGPGLIATFGALFLVNVVFDRFNPSDHGEVMRQVIWVAASVGVSLLAGKLRTARHRAEREAAAARQGDEQLRELTQRLNYHIDNSPLAVIEWGPDMRLTRWSGAAERIFGWKAGEVLGKRLEDFRWIYDDDSPQVAQVVSDLQNGKNPSRFSANRNYRKDGSVVHCEWYNSSLLDDSGNLRSILSLALEVTDRIKLEEALQQYSEMLEIRVAERTAELREKDRLLLYQSRLAIMGEMLNNIAHQWRQPLNVLGLNIQRLALFYETGDFSKELLDSSTRDAMKLIHHMSQTIDDFRNFFKPDKEKSDFSVASAIQQSISLVVDGFRHHQIALKTRLDGNARINGYPNEFSQVILNILQNARDALVEREIADGTITVTSTVRDGISVITISDNAGGIPGEIIDNIFEPYFSTKGMNGTGIGLFLSKNIIETNMGGSLTVRNGPDGAEFMIEI
ncbi:ATP-binding protein [Geobacter sp. AOG2]|uniref:ATP-binding protein n=1 Tax=Geobacter sp. AOG2 TaxID=1566347 RepID=UPI001CC461BD|nr:ATP-binding protein [Geobacter sp. AOG2]GFE62822.1 hypothetical protein AOG2_34110 [Geobacter sp. AOG2]